MKIVMHNKAFLVEVEKPADKTPAGLVIPEEAQKPNMFGRVVARFAHRAGIYEGTIVMFKKCMPADDKLLENKNPAMMYVIVEYDDIYASLEEEPEDIKKVAEAIAEENTNSELVN